MVISAAIRIAAAPSCLSWRRPRLVGCYPTEESMPILSTTTTTTMAAAGDDDMNHPQLWGLPLLLRAVGERSLFSTSWRVYPTLWRNEQHRVRGLLGTTPQVERSFGRQAAVDAGSSGNSATRGDVGRACDSSPFTQPLLEALSLTVHYLSLVVLSVGLPPNRSSTQNTQNHHLDTRRRYARHLAFDSLRSRHG
jgi:hypothetical protein